MTPRNFRILLAGVLWLSTATAGQQTVAYDAAAQTGNQAFTGNLGLDFDVNAAISVIGLGAFDNSANGFAGTVTVGIFSRDTGTLLAGPLAFNGAAGILVNGNRFLPLSPPILLPVGHYSVVAVGFNAIDRNGNTGIPVPSVSSSSENTGGGLISFVAPARTDAHTTLNFPAALAPASLGSNPFLAGTFQFTAAPAPLDAPYQVRYAANLQFGDSHLNIINAGANGAALLGPGLGATGIGNVCVNVYAVTNDEQLAACCSCLVTPSQVVHLSVNGDLLPNSLTTGDAIPVPPANLPAIAADDEPSDAETAGPPFDSELALAIPGFAPALRQRNALIHSITIKLVGSLAGVNGIPASCTNSAAMLTQSVITGGFVATGTTLHATPVANNYATTETPFLPAQFVTTGNPGASDELHSLSGRCANILGNGGGYGICKACSVGALGAVKR